MVLNPGPSHHVNYAHCKQASGQFPLYQKCSKTITCTKSNTCSTWYGNRTSEWINGSSWCATLALSLRITILCQIATYEGYEANILTYQQVIISYEVGYVENVEGIQCSCLTCEWISRTSVIFTVRDCHTLKRKCRHFAEIFITACIGSCQNSNFHWKPGDNNFVKMTAFPFRCTNNVYEYINEIVQACNNAIASAPEFLQSCAKPPICFLQYSTKGLTQRRPVTPYDAAELGRHQLR